MRTARPVHDPQELRPGSPPPMHRGARQALRDNRGGGAGAAASRRGGEAERATAAARRGEQAAEKDWEAVAQLAAAQCPEWGGERKREAQAGKEIDAERREMVWAMVRQRRAAEERGRAGERWMRQREAHLEWMHVVMRSWREVSHREVLEGGERPRVRWQARRKRNAEQPAQGVTQDNTGALMQSSQHRGVAWKNTGAINAEQPAQGGSLGQCRSHLCSAAGTCG